MNPKIMSNQPHAKGTTIAANCKICGIKFSPKSSLLYLCPKCYLTWSISKQNKIEDAQNEIDPIYVQKSSETNEQLFDRAVDIFRKQISK